MPLVISTTKASSPADFGDASGVCEVAAASTFRPHCPARGSGPRGQIWILELKPGPDRYRDISRISKAAGTDSSFCAPGAADGSGPNGVLSIAKRNLAEIVVRRSEQKMRNACAQCSHRGLELSLIISEMMFCRARRSTRKTSACVVRRLSLKDSIRQ